MYVEIGRKYFDNTVVAGFVVEHLKTNSFQCVSVGVGTKYERTLIDYDCHAEVLARKGFEQVLNKWVKAAQNEEKDQEMFSKEDGKLVPQFKVHLYSSSQPCGNSSLKKFATMTKIKKMDESVKDKCIEQDHSYYQFNARDKGEVDIQEKTNSIHLSCSAKISLWNLFGVQGIKSSILPHLKEPLYLSSITIGRKFSFETARRGLCCRLQDFTKNSYSLKDLDEKRRKKKYRAWHGKNAKKIKTIISNPKFKWTYQTHHPILLQTSLKLDEGAYANKEMFADFDNPVCAMWYLNIPFTFFLDGSSGDPLHFLMKSHNKKEDEVTEIVESVMSSCFDAYTTDFSDPRQEMELVEKILYQSPLFFTKESKNKHQTFLACFF